ncbi:MAG: FAD-dependent monooxygenase [Chlamydiales bacterium]|nr:FAD-dependent monooxygenase [Chlamydiales bacterium]
MIVKKLLVFILCLLPIMSLPSKEINNDSFSKEETMKETRILISGGGIAGFTLAYWLKQRGYSPIIIEKHPCLREGGYKVDVRGTALEVAKRMGIYQDLLDANVNLKKSKLVTPHLSTFEFEGDILGHCSEGDIEVNRWDLVQILSRTVGEIEVIYDDSITMIDELVHFEKGDPREFDLVIGADGLYSNVRRIAFGEDSEFLRKYGIHFCVFPSNNIFDLDHSEIVYFDRGKFVAAYAADHHSYACLAFRSEMEITSSKNLKDEFEKQFGDLGWEIPQLISAMKSCDDCYFNSIAQVRMPCWSKGRVALVGDAAHAASAMGTSLSMVGSYVLAREIEKSDGDYEIAFNKYEQSIRSFVEDAQDLAEANHQLLAGDESSMKMTLQLYLMKILPKKFIQFITKRGREQMRKVANGFALEPVAETGKSDEPT